MVPFRFKTASLILLLFMAYSFAPVQQAKAMEPISIAMMAAPIALPIIKALLPYIIRGAVNMVGAMIEVGVEMFNIILLPVGLFETTLGAYWWFSSGVTHLIDGSMAIPKTVFQILLILPKTIGVM